ncbi:Oidioi.mRNA.OKI2018_I69.XSR.g16760.t1.cds [Oikopleura dioica]|uniref:Oidioi.mRNA.OKI2018_I69.XSR.g16760.t1.cds n=1 Tax=Oikopleura dioica TaxID=34765 RepID=A0ABN7SH62_OIKDI|nr:Oidioi.mRNA.OKI2018_I69.XSR.g16760.t1.cds [Oikopleura dioica]
MERRNNELKFEDYESDDPERALTGRLFWKPEKDIAANLRFKDFQCKICREDIADPVVTACCDSYVCRKCWTDDLHTSDFDGSFHSDCPICFKAVDFHIDSPHGFYPRFPPPPTFYAASKFFLKMMNARMVRCCDTECKMEMKFEDFDEHWEKFCKRLVRCDFCLTESRVQDGHLCQQKFRAKKEEMKKELEAQKQKYKNLIDRQRRLFYEEFEFDWEF